MPDRKLSDRRARHDRFYKRARREGFAARSVYKLKEIDARVGLLRKGMRVLDLGCWPGSWLQHAAGAVGPTGALVGVDRFAPDVELPPPGARLIAGDVFSLSPEELRGDLAGFDVVLSDMAPDVTGVRNVDQARSEALFERALEIAEATLCLGGGFLGKLFQGPGWDGILARCRAEFSSVRVIRPESTRRDSIERYVVCQGLRESKI